MNKPDTDEDIIDRTKEELETYIQLRYQLMKLELGEKAAKLTGLLASTLILVLLFFFSTLFVSLLGGFYFSDLLGSNLAGFGVIAGIYVLLFILVLFFKKSFIETPAINKIIAEIFNDYE